MPLLFYDITNGYIFSQEVLQVLHNIELSLQDLGKGAIGDRKESLLGLVFAMDEDFGGIGQPQRKPIYQLQYYATKAPHVNAW